MRALERKLLRDLWAQRSQVLAIAAVVATGVALLFAARTTFGSLLLTQDTYYAESRFADLFASAKRAPLWVAERAAEIPGVLQTESRVVVGVNLDLQDMEEPSQGLLVSVPDRGEPELNQVTLSRGRWIDPLRDDEAIASQKFADAHNLQPGDTLAAVINGRRKNLRVVGVGSSPEYVYAISPGDLFPDPRRFGILWMARRPLAAAFDMEGGFNDLTFRLLPGTSEENVIEHVDRLLQPYGGRGAIPRRLQLSNWYLANELKQLENTGLVVPLLFLAVSAFLLNVVLVRLVAAQREQIAALKALGYANRAIGWHYVQWALGVSLLGAALGLAGGLLLSRNWLGTYETYFGFPRLILNLSWSDFAVAVAVSLAASVLGALSAVRLAVRLAPAEAMRPAPPASYRPSAIERIAGWLQLSVAWRIIFRNLARRPIRSGLSVLGIAFAGATVVLGSSLVTSITHLATVLFDRVQRQDITVTLFEPASARAEYGFASLPGVLSVEPVRTLAAELRFGPRSRQIGVVGLVREPALWRVLDGEETPVALPREGIVLSRGLAEVLGVAVGDPVVVEVQEGARPVLEIPVARVIDDFVGTSAYLEIDTMRRMLGEGPTLSGAVLAIDQGMEPELYRALKRTPRVAGVAVRSATIANFETFLTDNIGSMMLANLLFAFVIAFGVIYNTARVSLAERARELASLRVLGFRRKEISAILLGELGLLTAVAIPLGFVLGVGLVSLTVRAFETELYRIPAVADRQSFLLSAVAVVGSMIISALVVRRRLHELDLVAVLKSRE